MSAQAIFLSYASQDAEAAHHICEVLRAAGLEVWFDQSELRGGDSWDASIKKQIKECALFVPIISNNTQAREEGYFRLEWKLAVDRSHLMADDKAFFFPVVLDDVAEPKARVPDKFRERQWSRLNDEAATLIFAERIAKLVGGGGVSGKSASNTSPNGDSTDSVGREKRSVPTNQPPEPRGHAALSQSYDTRDTPSIAVMPFVNMSRDEENEFFADGLAEELLNVIAKIRGLRVAARTSAFSFKGKGVDIQTIAAKLNVGHVLEGSVRKSGNRIRVTAQLISAADGYYLWSETYDRTLDDIFVVQDDIAQSVVKQLQATLFGNVSAAKVEAAIDIANKGRSANAEAYRLWLQGRQLFKRQTRDDIVAAIDYFRRALALDAQYAAAWAELGHALYWRAARAVHTDATDYLRGYQEAMAAVQQAIAIEPELPIAYVALAYLHGSIDWNERLGEASIRKALALAPGDGDVVYHAALHMISRGHLDEALVLCQRAIDLDPLNQNGYALLARAHFYLGRIDEAEAGLKRAEEMGSTRWSRDFLFRIMLAQGRIDDAAAFNADEPLEYTRKLRESYVAWARGQRAEADTILSDVIGKYTDMLAWQFAEVYAFRGDADRVFEWLDICHQQHDPGAHWALADPFFKPFHDDPRWKPMMQKLGFAV